MTTIKGSTNSEGLFSPTPPYVEGALYSDYDAWYDEHPSLYCYNQQGELVKGLNDVEVTGPVWQFFGKYYNTGELIERWEPASKTGISLFKTFDMYEKYWAERNMKTRQIYLTVPPTESKPENWEDSTFQLPVAKADAQPVKEVVKFKKAEEILSEYNPNHSAYVHVDDAIGAINDFHSQFATEAVGKKNDKGFYGYVVTERLKAAELLSEGWLDKEPKHRVAIENLLIAYDQMMDKLEPEATKPNNLVDVEEVIKYLKGLKWPSEWWLGEIEKQLKSMVK